MFHELKKNLKVKLKYRKVYRDKDFLALRDLAVTIKNRNEGVFDPDWYLLSYPDVSTEGQDPFYHYLNHGYLEGRNPGPLFDTNFYLRTYEDVRVAKVNPLIHYLTSGRSEGRVCNEQMRDDGHLSDYRSVEVRHVIIKEIAFEAGGDATILVTHAPAGRLKPHVLPYMELLRSNGLSVLLVAVVDRPLELRPAELEAASGVIVRDNAGYDFGAWAHALKIVPELFGAKLLLITNDSIVPTSDASVFRVMIERVRGSESDITGLTASHEYDWHVSSYFLACKPKALSSWAFQHFIRDIQSINDKDAVVRTYEVPFAKAMQNAGLTVEVLYEGIFSSNPTLFSWRELIAQGFPFVKILLLRKQFLEGTDWPKPIKSALKDLHEGWPKALKAAGFDVDLIRAAIRASDLSDVPIGGDNGLLVDPNKFEPITKDHTLRVAYFGPWNYDNGLGAASRELLSALKRNNVKINSYPITSTFHVHRLICPSVPTIEFSARPDVAIVHLNPDSWHLLSPEQREIINFAKQRIGYWVWETDTLPPAWKHDLLSVDRIWAPSNYCAEVFSASVGIPVDVIPHPVPIPSEIVSDRQAILNRMGVDPSMRVILYIFDGASYLIRKNPEALILAFSKSGLASRGWILLLKVKHLYDRPEAGGALSKLADATAGVILADISLPGDEVTSLIAAADIYASPHCSEGFGLTVAEAMAVGKAVIATDFGGPRDFLDASCGYIVPSTPWTLEEDHGHYLKGHTWARVDVDSFAAALVQAAESITAGDGRIGSAAKARVGSQLSYSTVAELIGASLEAAIIDSEHKSGKLRSRQSRKAVISPPTPPEYRIDPNAGVRFENVKFSDGVIPVSLSDDLSWQGGVLPPGNQDDWLFFANRNARVRADADHFVRLSATKRPDVALFYADDAAAKEDIPDRVFLKPDFDKTLLVAQDYIGVPVIIRRQVFEGIGGLDRLRGTAALFDLVLSAAEAGHSIGRIPEVLIVHEGARPVADIDARRASLLDRDSFRDIELLRAEPAQLLQRRRFAERDFPHVSILIPTNRTRLPGSEKTYIEQLLSSISLADWPLNKVTVIVGDNEINEPSWADKNWPFRLLRVTTPEHSGDQFNYAAKANLLWQKAADEYVVFMNDDAVPNNPGWLRALVGFLIDQSIGCVGGQLFYEDGSIQHAGIFPALRTVVHAWLNWPADSKTYMNWANTQREWSTITGAIFATRRSILDRVNGFDERFSLEFNDVDLCLRIRNLGYRIVYNPDAQFTHAEKASRGDAAPPGAEVALFLSLWSDWLEQDPASHPNFAKNRMDLVPCISPSAWFLKK